jgi:hypothetical protein
MPPRPVPPQLVHLVTGNEPLPSRPSREPSQSAAEATLGLVTIDVLGLDGAGVPPLGAPQIDGERIWDYDLGTSNGSIGAIIPAGVSMVLVGVMAVLSGELVAVQSVTSRWVPAAGDPGSPVPSGGLNAWWWLPMGEYPPGALLAFDVTVAGGQVVNVLFENLSRLKMAGAPTQAPVSATGTTSPYRVTFPQQTAPLILDQGWVEGVTAPTPEVGQLAHYSVQSNSSPPYRKWFASQRSVGLTMGWTGPSAPWAMSALIIPEP